MDARTAANARRSAPRNTPTGRAAQNGNEEYRHDQPGPGIDLPVVGHVEYKSAGFLAGLGIAGAIGVIDWPVAAAVGIGYALARRE